MFEILEVVIRNKYLFISTIFFGIYIYLKFVVYTYWKRKGLHHDDPTVPIGNMSPVVLGKLSVADLLRNSYEKYKKHRYHGIYMFHKPMLMINDPELIRTVLIKEFNKFRDRGLYYNEEVDPLSGHLFLLPGEKWRQLRAKLTPTFSSGKLKQMFPLLQEIGDELVITCNKMFEESDIIELKDLIGRYTTDSISSIAYGFNCKSLDDPENDFKRHGAMVFDQNPLKITLGTFAPVVLDIFRIPLVSREVINFFSKTFRDMVYYRRQNDIVRKDFFYLLMQLMDKGLIDEDESMQKNDVSNDGKLTIIQAAAQAFVFFLAGFETTSSMISYCLYELALNLNIQDKLQAEIDEALKKPGGMTYERILNELEYLHMVFAEALRKHPSVPFLIRVCNEDCDLPNTDLRIEKGTGVVISVTGLQKDPNIFPNPEKFDPERFTKENIAARSPYVYIPFGDGPRACIGTRFGLLQSKIALVSLLAKYKFYICEKTPIPMKYSKRSFTQSPEGGVYVRVEKRTK